jgi:hypothetical protein
MSEAQKDVQLVIAKAWSDPAFKAQLLKNPSAALATVGIAAPKGMTIKVHENTATEQHFVLPTRAASSQLSDEHLESIAGGLTGLTPQLQRGSKGQ